MDKGELKVLLQQVQQNDMSIDSAVKELEDFSYKDLGFAKIDNEREIRNGYPEVIYCAGKTIEQIVKIIEFMMTKKNNILATRADKDTYEAVLKISPAAVYNELGRVITIRQKETKLTDSYIAIVSAGTSDLPVVEEATATAEILGNKVEKVVDVGVAGIHRLFDKIEIIRGAKVVIVVAGMEGALASVVGGLVDKPLLAVPTSVGYGTSFGGLTALLTMLNSCASGISVVNIDNGFGAAYSASMINHL